MRLREIICSNFNLKIGKQFRLISGRHEADLRKQKEITS